ncbi:granulysin [Rhynchonycteris naso]
MPQQLPQHGLEALLLLALVLLGSPGVAFSSLTPECYDLVMATLWDGEQLNQSFTQEGPQAHLLTMQEGQGGRCWFCRKIIKKLRKIVGEQPNKDTIAQATSRVCNMQVLLRGLCKRTIKIFLRRISKDIMAGKTPQEVCVDIRMCKPQAGREGLAAVTCVPDGVEPSGVACVEACGVACAVAHEPACQAVPAPKHPRRWRWPPAGGQTTPW